MRHLDLVLSWSAAVEQYYYLAHITCIDNNNNSQCTVTFGVVFSTTTSSLEIQKYKIVKDCDN